jgi:hypothetical protein
MGIRPSINLVMGIPQIKKEDIPEIEWDKDVILKPTQTLKEGLNSEEFKEAIREENVDNLFVNSLLCHDPDKDRLFGTSPKTIGECISLLEMEDGHILGYKVRRNYNDDCIWDLKAIYPKYAQNSYDILPPVPFEEYYPVGRLIKDVIAELKTQKQPIPLNNFRSIYKKHPEIKKYRRWAKNGWLVHNGEYDTTLVAWAKAAMMLFDQIGFEYKPNQIRCIFAVEWS